MNIWEATVDNNTWKVQVVDTGNYSGRLEVIRVSDGEVVYKEALHVAFNAAFGPDAADVACWQEKAIEVIDSQPTA